jgi:hypothetical protein
VNWGSADASVKPLAQISDHDASAVDLRFQPHRAAFGHRELLPKILAELIDALAHRALLFAGVNATSNRLFDRL